MSSSTFVITYDTNGGFPTQFTKELKVDDVILYQDESDAVQREGYTIDKWYMKRGGKMEQVVPGLTTYDTNLGTTCFAMWIGDECSISWNGNGGDVDGEYPATKNYGEVYGNPNTAKRTGYEFLGWFTKSQGGVKYNPSGRVKGDITFFAHWERKYCTVTFMNSNPTKDPDAKVIKTTRIEYNGTVECPETPSRGGYEFHGWKYVSNDQEQDFSSDTEVTGDLTVFPKLVAIHYNVKYELGGGTGGPPDGTYTIDSGYTVPKSPKPTRTGYTFAGWSRTTIPQGHVGDVTITAKWDIVKYDIKFNSNGGTPAEQVRKVAFQDRIGELPTAEKVGHTLDGWFTEQSGGTEISAETIVTGETTYYAHWSRKQFTLTFDANGGKIGTSATTHIDAYYDDTLESLESQFPAATMTGYTLQGWFTMQVGGIQLPNNLKVFGNATYYAHWTPNTYTIRFHHNVPLPSGGYYYAGEVMCGDIDVKDQPQPASYYYEQEMTYGVAKHLLSNKFTRKHVVSFNKRVAEQPESYITVSPERAYAVATFDGWATSPDGDKTYKDGQYVSNLANGGVFDLYAIWIPGSVTLADASSRGGWDFGGWITGGSSPIAVGMPGEKYGNVTGPTALYTTWIDRRIKVTYHRNFN